MALDDRTSNLLFLLSLAPVVAGCPAGDDTGSGETTTSTPTTTGPSTSTADGTGTSAMTSEGTSASTGPGPSTGFATAFETTGGGLDCEEYPPMMFEGPVDPACVAVTDKYDECYYGGSLSQLCVDYYLASCQYYLEYSITQYGEMCGMAYLDLYSCISALTCDELQMGGQCEAEDMARLAACSA